MNGQLVKKVENITKSEICIDASEWISGVYLYQLISRNGYTGQGRFIKGSSD
jgi:hypothetical protein